MADDSTAIIFRDAVGGIFTAPVSTDFYYRGVSATEARHRVLLLVHGHRVHYKFAANKEEAIKIRDTLLAELQSA
jgi:hypothetical protein